MAQGEICIICEKTRKHGIHVLNQLICESCQKDIISTEVDDEKYQLYIKKLSKLNDENGTLKAVVGGRSH